MKIHSPQQLRTLISLVGILAYALSQIIYPVWQAEIVWYWLP